MGYLYTYVKSFFQLAACRLPLGPGVPLTQCIVQLRCSVRARVARSLCVPFLYT